MELAVFAAKVEGIWSILEIPLLPHTINEVNTLHL